VGHKTLNFVDQCYQKEAMSMYEVSQTKP